MSPLERITEDKEKAIKTIQTLNSDRSFDHFFCLQTFCILNIYLTLIFSLNLETLICKPYLSMIYALIFYTIIS